MILVNDPVLRTLAAAMAMAFGLMLLFWFYGDRYEVDDWGRPHISSCNLDFPDHSRVLATWPDHEFLQIVCYQDSWADQVLMSRPTESKPRLRRVAYHDPAVSLDLIIQDYASRDWQLRAETHCPIFISSD